MKLKIAREFWPKQHPEWDPKDVLQADFLYERAMVAPIDSKFLVEIGTHKGGSALILAAAAEEKGQILCCVDPFDLYFPDYSRIELIFRKNMKEAELTNWKLIKAFSEDAAPAFQDSIALLYIDGNHEYEYVLKDWKLWAPKLIPGGILMFHDRGHDGVSKVVDLVGQDQSFHNERMGPFPLISFEKKR